MTASMSKDYKIRKYTVVPYDPRWKEAFEQEKQELKAIFGNIATAIEHVGSTAVPGMASKPTIDALVLVKDMDSVDSLNEQMQESGYTPFGQYISPDMRFFAKEVNHTRLCNVHVSTEKTQYAQGMIQWRDYFINHPEVAKEYSQLKLDLAAKYPDDFGLYRKYKDEWIEELEKRIKEE